MEKYEEMKYWTIPKEMQEKIDKWKKTDKEEKKIAEKFITEFLEGEDINIKITYHSQLGRCEFSMNHEDILVLKLGFFPHSFLRLKSKHSSFVKPKSGSVIGKRMLRAWKNLGVKETGALGLLQYLFGEDSHLFIDFKIDKIGGEYVFIKLNGIDQEKFGLIEKEI